MEHALTVSLGSRPDLLYSTDELVVGQMRGSSPCSRKPFHAHEGYILEYVDTGSMWLLESKSRRSLVSQGYYYLLRPDQEHCQAVDPGIHTLFVGLPRQTVEEVARELAGTRQPILLEPTIVPAQKRVFATLATIAEEVAHSAGGMQLMLQSLSVQLAVQLLRSQHTRIDEGKRYQVSGALSPEIQRSIDFIQAHYTDDLSLNQVAASASLSPYHFLRLFKRQTGLTPHTYIRFVRLQRAATLLTRSDEPISAIAIRLGFASASHFTEAFRRHYGLTPSQYRAN